MANIEAPSGQEQRALPIGKHVQEFEILRIVGGGGFGIVYLARDHFLERHVALKEYMPPMASRVKGTTQVIVKSGPDSTAFISGLRKFLNEARLLARFDHPALVKVHRFWEENGTAYMAMPFYLGATLRKVVVENTVPYDESSLRQMLSPLLDAVAALHGEKCYHRDISPDNILLTPVGPVLLDFGAARRAIGDVSQNFTAILKEGYAPLEQYAVQSADVLRQGPWTDIYALAGVMRYIITGVKPFSAITRVASRLDPQEPLARIAAGRYSDAFLRAIDMGMALKVEERPQNIAEFRALLAGEPDSADADPPVLPRGNLDPSHGRFVEMVPGVLTAYLFATLALIIVGLAVALYSRLTRPDPGAGTILRPPDLQSQPLRSPAPQPAPATGEAKSAGGPEENPQTSAQPPRQDPSPR